eukprot:CAMPEP_0119360598 /NCGR_PEP_ID=MMETSP1334-20130426/8155_1 /TAXON_ID=127549 /ORGANISM="Calcidiscus leptoporus, Strain RCC1130" /LENGTH=187 /DNA_ID=CAMNT_0007375455 /DNA_START=24 /DNA_END=587 /DNA_ORIENTATION=-
MKVVPGQLLGEASTMQAGVCTYVWGQNIHASLAGVCTIDRSQQPPIVSVHVPLGDTVRSAPPSVAETVTCRVTRLNPRMAYVDILCVEGVALREACQGILHREDVREFDMDKIDMYESVRPSDIIQARILSLGDSRSYFITMAAPELGVAFAQSTEGATMQPLSYEEMFCPVTKARERRKVAKPEFA